jgi:hypothetical protein
MLTYADEAADWASCRCFSMTLNAVPAGSYPSNLKNLEDYLHIPLSKLTLKCMALYLIIICYFC